MGKATPTILAGVIAASVAIGCGGDSGDSGDDAESADTPEAVVQLYVDSVESGDGEQACALFTEEGLASNGLEGTYPENFAAPPEELLTSCEEQLAEPGEAYTDVSQVETTDETETTATVEMSEESETEGVSDSVTTVELVKEDDEWKIESSSLEGGEI